MSLQKNEGIASFSRNILLVSEKNNLIFYIFTKYVHLKCAVCTATYRYTTYR